MLIDTNKPKEMEADIRDLLFAPYFREVKARIAGRGFWRALGTDDGPQAPDPEG